MNEREKGKIPATQRSAMKSTSANAGSFPQSGFTGQITQSLALKTDVINYKETGEGLTPLYESCYHHREDNNFNHNFSFVLKLKAFVILESSISFNKKMKA